MNIEMNTTEKKKNTKKIIFIIGIPLASVALIIAAFVILLNVMFGTKSADYCEEQDYMYESTDEIYEYFSTEIENSYDITKFDSDVDEFVSGYEEGYGDVDSFVSVVDSAKPVSDEVQSYVDNANVMIVEYFEKNYNISVEARLDELKAAKADFRGFGGLGAYATEGEGGADGKTVFLSKNIIKSAKGNGLDFYATYIHEAIHYLGAIVEDSEEGCGDSYIWTYFCDGLAESITSDILAANDEPASRPNRYISSYPMPAHLVMQMYTANDELIHLLFDSDEYMTVAEIEDYFNSDDCEITAEEIAKAITISEVNGNEDSLCSSQYYIGEYCKSMEPSKEEQVEIGNYFIAYFSYFLD